MSRDRIIETYIERLLAWKEPITAEKLDALAADIGLGPDEIAAVRKQAQAHLSRGKNYIDYDCVDDAIEELTQAASLDPLNPEILQTLAAAYADRYQQTKKPADKTATVETAKRCLEVDPEDATATQLIASLEVAKKSPVKRIMGGIGTLLLVVGAFGSKPILKMLFQGNASYQPDIEIELDLPERDLNLDDIFAESAESGVSDTTVPTANSSSPAVDGHRPEVDIPILFEKPGLKIEPRLSRLNNYDDSSFYKLQGVLVNESDQEIESLRLQVDYLDKDGNVLLSNSTMAFDDYEGTLRPGDHHAFDLIQQINPKLAQLKLNVTTVDQLPAPASYPTAQTIDYTWSDTQQKLALKFDLTSRRENFSISFSGDSGYFEADWGITNTGDQAIRQLKLETTFYGDNNRKLGNKEVLVVYGSDAALLPGEVRPIHLIEELANAPQRYEVKVVEAE